MASDNPTKKIEEKEAVAKAKSIPLKYPADLGSDDERKFTSFRIYKYEKIYVDRMETKTLLGNIYLPIPPELSNTDGLEYEEFSSPVLGSTIAAAQKDGIIESARAFAGAAVAASSGILGKIPGGDGINNQTASLTGNSVNPRNTNIFKTPTAREHKYTYKLIARSQEESLRIRQIINRFRYHAYPDTKLDTAVYAAPDLFEISFKYNDKDIDDKDTFLFHPLPCALVAIAVAYNGSSTPVFFQQTGAPVEVTLSLVFKEMELDTKAKLMQRYNIFDGEDAPVKPQKSFAVQDTRVQPQVINKNPSNDKGRAGTPYYDAEAKSPFKPGQRAGVPAGAKTRGQR
jgi:hypothetical protein